MAERSECVVRPSGRPEPVEIVEGGRRVTGGVAGEEDAEDHI